MYRNNQSKAFQSKAINKQSTGIVFKDCPQNINKSPDNSVQSAVRSTAHILNLFKKPIANCETEEKNSKPIESSKVETQNEKENLSSTVINGKAIFNVVIGKISTRKHKKWDDDGVLEVNGRSAVLKNDEGDVIGRTTVNPVELVEGFRLHIGNKEIEIVDRVMSEVSSSNQPVEKVIAEPPQKRFKSLHGNSLHFAGSINEAFEPLVMPSINTTRKWLQDGTEKEQEVSVDACLASVLRPHQRRGVVFLYECVMGIKESDYFGSILADEMGLGKTLQCITIIWTLLKKGPYGKPTVNRVLIVTPSSLCDNWNKEFKRWLGSYRISPYIVNAKNKPKDFKKQSRNSIMIISYDMLIRCNEEVERIGFDLIICDEGHKLKNNDIKATKCLQNVNCKRRILLTGTPIQNDLQEFFALINFVNPGILGSNREYKNYYEDPIVKSRCPHASSNAASLGKERAGELHERTKRFILRRTQDTINEYLPSKHEIIVLCPLSKEQTNLYKLVTDSWFRNAVLPNCDVPHLTVITALKKICNHAGLFNSEKSPFLEGNSIDSRKALASTNVRADPTEGYCGKVTIVRTLMRNLRNVDERLVLISYYTKTLDLLENICRSEKLKFLRLDGGTPTRLRSKIVEEFNSKTNNNKVFLLSAKAGGVGLNLPGASRLVLFDSDWNPASDAQAMARIWRDGQKKSVYIYRLLTTGTIEEKIFQRQINKAGLSETVVDLNHLTSLKLSDSELKDLFTLTTDTECLTHDLMLCPCDGNKNADKVSEKSNLAEGREYQLFLGDKSVQQNLTINQLLEWEHYSQPVADNVMQEIMLPQVSDKVSFIFKNSTLR